MSQNGTLFELEAAPVGGTVTLRDDPTTPPARGVDVWQEQEFVVRARPLDASANRFVRRLSLAGCSQSAFRVRGR